MITEISKAYKFRIYPNDMQKEIIQKGIDVDRFIYNYMLRGELDTVQILQNYGLTDKNELKNWRTKHKLYFNAFEESKHLTILSKTEKYAFLNEVHATLRTFALRKLESAFKMMKKTGAGFPNFKKRGENNSYTIQVKEIKLKHIKGKRYTINIPSTVRNKLIGIPIVCHNEEFALYYQQYKVNSYTISKVNNKYYISIQVQMQADIPEKPEITKERTIGVDMGVVRPITASDFFSLDDNLYSQRIKSSTESDDIVKKLNRILANKRRANPNWKESNSYKRIQEKLNNEITSATGKKEWIRHNISSQLVQNQNYDTIVFEDLDLKNMTKRSAKGLSNRKSGLNRVLQNTGLGEIRTQVKYKSEWQGKNVVSVDPKHTSQKCSKCGHIQKENRVTQANFTCTKCGHHENADSNAAKNIKEKYFENLL